MSLQRRRPQLATNSARWNLSCRPTTLAEKGRDRFVRYEQLRGFLWLQAPLTDVGQTEVWYIHGPSFVRLQCHLFTDRLWATMATVPEDGTAAAAQQLGSMSLGDAVERTGDESEEKKEEAKKNGTKPKKMCSKCGKESDTLMKCRACKCVWYCDKDCQNRHWKEHKKECKQIKKELDKRGGKLDVGSELDLGPLPDLPPRDECPICLQLLPLHDNLQTYSACCGKVICGGCDLQHNAKSGGSRTCAFCRVPIPTSDKAALAQLRKRAKINDPRAICNLAMNYGFGDLELPLDQAKCIALLRQSAGIGFPPARYRLGAFYHYGMMGLQRNEVEAVKYYKEAAEGGVLHATHNLGLMEHMNGNNVAAMRHWRLSASGGYRRSIEKLIACFGVGLLHHGDLVETLEVMYRARAELSSKDRKRYIAHLKKTGEYDEGCDV